MRFKSAFFPVWRVATEWSAAGVVIVLFAAGAMGGAIPLLFHLLVLVMCAAVGSIVVALVLPLFLVEVSADGLRCYDGYGVYSLARWDAITKASPFNFLGLKYLRVYSTDAHRPRWLPLFLADMAAFERVVSYFAGTDHPLTLAMTTNAFKPPVFTREDRSPQEGTPS